MPRVKQGVLYGKPLAPRELEVLKLVALGNTAQEIGEALNIAGQTVKNHKENISEKIGASNSVELTHYALATGIVENLWKKADSSAVGI